MTQINIQIIGNGTVKQKPARIGPAIQLTAIPNSGATFIGWKGLGQSFTSGLSTCNVNPRYASDIVAVFSENPNPNQYQEVAPNTLNPLQFEHAPELISEKSALSNQPKFWIDDPTIQVSKVFDELGRFIINDDGTVLDQSTSLMWTYKVYPKKVSFSEAVEITKKFAGYADWKIPSIADLQSVMPNGKKFFPVTQSCKIYWSNHQLESTNAVVDDWGRIFNVKEFTSLLRLVRSVQRHPVKINITGIGSGDVKNFIVIQKNDGTLGKIPRTNNQYPLGTKIEVVAEPDSKSRFLKWSGDASGTDLCYLFTVDGPRSVVAEFELRNYKLKLHTTGSGEGSITPSTTAAEYPHGSVVTLTATPAQGSKFRRWSGDFSSTSPEITITFNDCKTVTAEFVRFFPFTVSTSGNGSGTVQRSTQANECEACSQVELNAVPAHGHRFVQWRGDATGTDPHCTLTIDGPKSVVAEFEALTYPLTGNQQALAEASSVGFSNDFINIDSKNGLMWKAMSEPNAVSYSKALKAPEFSGFSDWRLPTKEEFLLMLKNPVISGLTKGFYWTSSKLKTTDMFDGFCEIINENGLVRLCDSRKFGTNLVRYVRALKASQLTVVDKPDNVKGKPQGENLTDNNDGTISDYNTGLMWAKFRDDRAKSLQEAIVLTSDLAGFVDWRLPSSAELRTISPIDERFFPPPTRGYYFSSTIKKSDVSSSFDICELVTSAGMTDSFYINRPKNPLTGMTVYQNVPLNEYIRFVRHEDTYPINFTAFVTGSGVVTKKLLDGVKSSNPEIDGYTKNSLIEISAIPSKGSIFKGWRGDIKSHEATQSILLDSPKSIIVEFELQNHSLIMQEFGNGEGKIATNSTNTEYPHGSIVTLQATALSGSVFKGWGGDLRGNIDEASILMDESKTVTAEFVRLFPFTVSTSGNGSGTVKRSTQGNEYEAGSRVELNAVPAHGHRFVQWHGDATSTDQHCTLTIDGPKSVVAEFEVLTYPLILQITGSGEGSITPSTTAAEYPHGSVVTLTATPAQGSVFRRWGGDAIGSSPEKRITFDSGKTVTAEFVRMYSLSVSTKGKNQGVVQRSPETDEYEVGSTVKLRAIPAEGHAFVQWHGAAVGAKPTCSIAMNANKTVTAEFRPLPTFDLKVTHIGSGRGVVLPTNQPYWKGSVVSLVAKANDGCVFDGWGGDAAGLEANCTVTVNANLAITAAFSRVEVPDTDITVVFDSTVLSHADNREVTVFQFTVTNRTDRQIHIDIPLAGYVNLQGEEVEQTAWVKGMISGEKGATLRARTFRKMGLVFERHHLGAVKLGEHLHITVLQSKPAQRLSFAFRCTNASSQTLELVQASVESLAVENENGNENSSGNSKSGETDAQAELTARMQLLEKSLQEALSRLSAPAPTAPAAPAAPTQTLPEVLAWLCTQNHVPLAVLRQKLLPLGLMPSALINDVNERAFDVTGEAALNEAADTVTVQRGVLLQVLAVW